MHLFPEVYENLGSLIGDMGGWNIPVRDYKIDTQFYEMKLGRPTMVFMRKGRRSSDIGKR